MSKVNHILLINDNPIQSLFSQIILEDANICELITVCQSIQEALEFLSNTNSNSGISFPDLILLDITMPCYEAINFLEAYHSQYFHFSHNTNIAIFSTSNDTKLAEQVKKLDAATTLVPSPLTMATLCKVLTLAYSYTLSKQF